jgi:hypothetical protein
MSNTSKQVYSAAGVKDANSWGVDSITDKIGVMTLGNKKGGRLADKKQKKQTNEIAF